jgi:hypothetical protein
VKVKKIARGIAAASLALSATLISTPAEAASFTWNSRPLINLDPNGTNITGTITNFPTKAGLYIFQCTKAKSATERPENCFDLAWVTATGGQGATSAKDPISFLLKANYSTSTKSVDCTIEECGVFFQYDRAALTDTSQDTFLPMTFAAVTTPVVAKKADTLTVTLNGKPLTRNVSMDLKYRAKTIIVATSESGLPVTLSSATSDCSFANGAFTALKGSGVCRLSATTAGNEIFDAASLGYPFTLVPGVQSIGFSITGAKKGTTRALPAFTNFGSAVVYTSKSKSCVVESNLMTVGRGKSCILTVKAAGKDLMWAPLSTTLKVNIK